MPHDLRAAPVLGKAKGGVFSVMSWQEKSDGLVFT
jgi:hypothetical protein